MKDTSSTQIHFSFLRFYACALVRHNLSDYFERVPIALRNRASVINERFIMNISDDCFNVRTTCCFLSKRFGTINS